MGSGKGNNKRASSILKRKSVNKSAYGTTLLPEICEYCKQMYQDDPDISYYTEEYLCDDCRAKGIYKDYDTGQIKTDGNEPASSVSKKRKVRCNI